MVNGAPRKVPKSTRGTSQGGPFTMIAPRVSHRFSFLWMYWTSSRARADTAHAPAGKKLLGERSVERGNSASGPSSIIHNVT